jgi:FAD/FMN-containing dehydrogenase
MFRYLLLLFFTINPLMADDDLPQLTGKIIKKDQSGYDEARLTSNYYPSKNQFPEVIVYAQNGEDVQHAILWARHHKRPVRIRSGGHNHEAFSTGTGALVIDVSEMKQLAVDREKKIAKVGPGVTGKELYSSLFEQGLTQVGGTCSDVGISGLILTGGIGPLLRREGLACDSLLSLEMVDANGKILTVTKDNEHKDLFWACCGGGGGNFGVVISLTLKVYPAPNVTWFNIGWDWKQPVDKIIMAWQDFFDKDDRKWFSHLDVWAEKFSIDKFHKQPIKIMGVFWGTPEEARSALTPLLAIGTNTALIETVTWKKAIQEFEDSTAIFITDKPEYKSTGAFAKQKLPEEAINIIVDSLKKATSPLFNVLLFSMGGAAAEIPPTATAYYYRKAPFFVCYTNQWLDPSEDRQQIADLDQLRRKLLPYTEGAYSGNPDRSLTNYLQDYYGGNVERLLEVKRKYDPDNLFRFEQGLGSR